MGDKSPKDKLKKQKQHDKDHHNKEQRKIENMQKNRKDHGQPAQDDQYKKAG